MNATDLPITGFSQRLDQHSAWRRGAAERLKALGEWLQEQQLLDATAQERIHALGEQLLADKVMVAFVAEFSRGKSELINAVFFAGYGRRIMPASAGRTTMCPTELGWEPALPPCLRLLPIESRLQPQALMEWRLAPEQWRRVDLDVNDADQLASAMEMVSEVRRVSVQEARMLGFWHDERPEDNPPRGADGLVEVPRWRHALINMAHPLLRQGLVVLDTPGLNAIGAEPELTVNLIAQAQAVVFVLGADTGVTRSDLAIWREHLAPAHGAAGTQLVVLNKIDTLWDELSQPRQIEAQIQRQRTDTARTLEVGENQVLALSAQKGLLAKVRGDAALLRASGLAEFERELGGRVLGARHRVLEAALQHGVQRLQADATRVLGVQRRALVDQLLELKGLRGKNHAMIRHMRRRVEQEKQAFDRGSASVLAVRSVHVKLLREVFSLLSGRSIKRELADLSAALGESGLKLGARKVYAQGFDGLRSVVDRVRARMDEIQAMLDTSFARLNTEHGFALQVPAAPDLEQLERDLATVERSHVQYLGMGNMMQLVRPEFCERLTRALYSRVRAIFETALGEIELWNKSISGQLDVELRERRRAFTRRIEAIQRVQDAAGDLGARLQELEAQVRELGTTEDRLALLASRVMAPEAQPTEALALEAEPG
ncbi:MAG TPA: dynamin family protein [Ottowia sp.]|uniref:dynamin family protein n=1 Tax=Ottowia sp. TaxID=1898956 RepID=UPI002C4E75D6|nr:dynamin family protein [Ottowia sp.]HMN21633.1 dynamin family protein [Ottowia sp.]